MPRLDFSEIYRDSIEFLDTFDVTRSIQTIDNNGRAVNTPKVYPGIYGIVNTSGSAILNHFPEAEHLTGKIVVLTAWRLTPGRGQTDIDADLVLWNGRTYEVEQIGDWSRLGTGYVKALCSLKDTGQ